MPSPADPEFDYALLLEQLGPARTRFDLDHVEECISTNTEMLARAARGAPSGSALVCNKQTAGRGRRGRQWISSPGHSLCFSLLWRLPESTPTTGLSLAAGLAVALALENLSVPGVELKWPNDIWLNGRKLGGLLIEAAGSPQFLVVGIGLNLKHDAAWQNNIDQAFSSLEETGLQLKRETLLASILGCLADMLDQFSLHGFPVFRCAWQARHALNNMPVRVSGESSSLEGICGKVRNDGALEILTPTGAKWISGGDLSLRPQPLPERDSSCTS